MALDETKPPLSFRKLKTAWSVFWGLACVLLIVLWVRSYYYLDSFGGPPAVFSSWRGRFITNGKFYLGISPDDPQLHIVLGHRILTAIDRNNISYDGDCVPVGVFVFLTAVAIVSPWLPWRFSLRTLLIATTLVAVVLGLVVYAASK